jgi:2-polyprenyl-3-methyl-5-hydroxy-6-metoxy-1,4-benzoquinol methylase
LLEIACTSGFSSRELAIVSGCSGIAIDISKPSVEIARYNKDKYARDIDIEYVNVNENSFEPKEKFSHVVVGAALKFLPDPHATVQRIISKYIKDNGFLLASPFYVTRTIPKNIIEKAKNVFGIDITTESYKEVMEIYSGLEIVYEDRCQIFEETAPELKHYCDSTIERACEIRGITNSTVKQAMYDRLMEIKNMSNELRPYQMYSVLVLRYRSQIYPKRYTEIF